MISPASDPETPSPDWIPSTTGLRIASAMTVSVPEATITHNAFFSERDSSDSSPW